MRRIFRKWVLQALFLLFISYLMVYVLLSAGGKDRIVKGEVQWCPYGLNLDIYRNEDKPVVRGSFLGYVFAPLILADRTIVHRSCSQDSEKGRAVQQREEAELKASN